MGNQKYFNDIEKYNSMEILEDPPMEENLKRAFESVDTTVEAIIDQMVENKQINEADIPKITGVLKDVKIGAVTAVLEWDKSKSTEDNIAHITGQITQDLAEGLAGSGVVLGGTAVASIFLSGITVPASVVTIK